MSFLPEVAVFGATGAQGGSVIRALAATSKYQIRALTRDPSSEKAIKCIANLKNIKLVQCDLNNTTQVRSAVKDCWAVFGVTNFWDPEIFKKPELEMEQGKRLVDAVDEAKVNYFIWSSLPGILSESHGKYPVPHFDQKYEIGNYAKEKKGIKSLLIMAPFYYSNLVTMMAPVRQEDGSLQYSSPIKPDAPIHMYDVEDTGAIIAKLLENPDEWINQDITLAQEAHSMKEVAEVMSRHLNSIVTFKELSKEEYFKIAPPALADEIYNMFLWFQEDSYFGQRNPYIARDQLKVPLKTLEQFLKNCDWKGPAVDSGLVNPFSQGH